MSKSQITKSILSLLGVFLAMPIAAQNNLQNTFDTNGPSKENIRIDLVDDEGNQGYLPVSILKGKKQGPVFTIVAGVHGFEYPPIVATQELLQEIDPEKLTGTLIVIPIANTSAFFSRTPFINPQDKVNLNNAFPGSATGSITQKIAHTITTEVIPLTDVFLDIHGGDANEDLLPYVCYYNNLQKPKQTQKARKLADVSGFEYVVSYRYTLKDDEPAKYVFKQAVQVGKTALSIESGKLGNVQKESVTLIKNGVYNMLNEMGMYHKTVSVNSDKIINLNRQAYIKSAEKGIFYSNHLAGDSVEESEIVGHISDEFGKIISEIKATHSGIILYKIGTPPVSVGETIMCISYSID